MTDQPQRRGSDGNNRNNENHVSHSSHKSPLPSSPFARLYERKLAALEALKKSLLHQAFTGEL